MTSRKRIDHKRVFYARHNSDEIIDRVEIICVPRFKTSGLSGDEWRVSYLVKLQRKGRVMYSRPYNTMSDAAAHLPWLLRTWSELPDEEIPEWIKQIDRDKTTCHQPGCSDPAAITYRVKTLFSREGYPQPEADRYGENHRAFCARHAKRGNASMEDSDSNYARRSLPKV